MKQMTAFAVAFLVIVIVAPSARIVTASGPRVDGLTFKVYSSSVEALQALKSGEVDLVPVDLAPDVLATLKDNPNLKLTSIPDFSFTYIGINLRNKPLNNPALRQAMAYGFNRAKLVNDVLQGYGEVLGAGLFSSAYAKLGWQNTEINTYQYDPDKAKQLLDDAGFKMPKTGNFRTDPSTKSTLSTIFIYSELGKPIEVATADEFARDMQAIGIPVLHLAQPSFDFGAFEQTYGFDLMVLSEQAGSAPTWLYDLFSTSADISPVPLGTNLVGYHNHAFDSNASEIRTSTNPDDAKAAALRCQEQLAKDLPVIPAYSKYLLLAAASSVSEVVPVVGSMPATIRQTALTAKVGGDFGGELRVGVSSDFGALDPTSSSGTADWLVLDMLAEPLLGLDQDGKLAPGLADRWSLAQDGESVSFSIRNNAKFHTGEPVKASDLAATITWLKENVRTSSPLYATVGMIDRAEVTGDREVKVTLKEANGFAANTLAKLFALPEGRLAKEFEGNFVPSQILVSSGPFTLAEVRQGEDARLDYNAMFYDAPPEHKGATQTVEASKGEILFGARVTGGTEITIETKPVTYGGQTIENGNYTLSVFDNNGTEVLKVDGTHKGQGVYTAKFSADDPSLSIGDYFLQARLYGATSKGQLVILDERNLIVKTATPIVLILLIVIIIAVVAVGAFFFVRKRKLKLTS